VRHRVSVSLSGIVRNQRYSTIGFCQFALGLGGPTITVISPSGPGLGAVGSIEVPRLRPNISVGPFSPCGVPCTGVELLSSREALGK
jgi:hypothetical protein